jgi:hypothetical protein
MVFEALDHFRRGAYVISFDFHVYFSFIKRFKAQNGASNV